MGETTRWQSLQIDCYHSNGTFEAIIDIPLFIDEHGKIQLMGDAESMPMNKAINIDRITMKMKDHEMEENVDEDQGSDRRSPDLQQEVGVAQHSRSSDSKGAKPGKGSEVEDQGRDRGDGS